MLILHRWPKYHEKINWMVSRNVGWNVLAHSSGNNLYIQTSLHTSSLSSQTSAAGCWWSSIVSQSHKFGVAPSWAERATPRLWDMLSVVGALPCNWQQLPEYSFRRAMFHILQAVDPYKKLQLKSYDRQDSEKWWCFTTYSDKEHKPIQVWWYRKIPSMINIPNWVLNHDYNFSKV